MNFQELKSHFAKIGCIALYAKPLAENDNSKNQVYFAGAVETLNVFPAEEIYSENTKTDGPTFKAKLNFGWLLENGHVAPAPKAQLILYAQYPEVRFSGFLHGCKAGPSLLMADRQRAARFSAEQKRQLIGRILFLGVTKDRKTVGYVAAGNSHIAVEFKASSYPQAFGVFSKIDLPSVADESESKENLLRELYRIHQKGWIDSKQLDSNFNVHPCNAPQCGGFTLEAELGIPKNSRGEPDFLGWEIKQHNVSRFDRLEAGTITLMTPEPSGGYYSEHGPEAFIRRFGYPDRQNRADRFNFGGLHRVGIRHLTTKLTMALVGYDVNHGVIKDATGYIALVNDSGEVAASWAFSKILEHWSRKHTKAVYVPSQCRIEPQRQYAYGHIVRLAERTDSLRLLAALARGTVFYDPGIKLENASTKPQVKRRSQFRVASRNISSLYEKIETVRL